jgi:putative transcriptional regulator
MTAPARQPKKTIRQLRQARGWSQMELALRLGLSQGTISDWERGLMVPRPKMQLRLADLFGVSVEQIALAACRREAVGARECPLHCG